MTTARDMLFILALVSCSILGGCPRASDQIVIDDWSRPPLANAGPDLSVVAGDPVVLDANASSDPDGDSLSYRWTQVSGPEVSLQAANQVQAQFRSPVEGTYEFLLTVTDGRGASAHDAVRVTVTPPPARAILAPPIDGFVVLDNNGVWEIPSLEDRVTASGWPPGVQVRVVGTSLLVRIDTGERIGAELCGVGTHRKIAGLRDDPWDRWVVLDNGAEYEVAGWGEYVRKTLLWLVDDPVVVVNGCWDADIINLRTGDVIEVY